MERIDLNPDGLRVAASAQRGDAAAQSRGEFQSGGAFDPNQHAHHLDAVGHTRRTPRP
ncbi:Uncharacterised protein [Mycobacteroides abscessus subsp. abscessus]|nr:Uncharacterised protein [Mycobacteroides abscessus subsp. abscessus]